MYFCSSLRGDLLRSCAAAAVCFVVETQDFVHFAYFRLSWNLPGLNRYHVEARI